MKKNNYLRKIIITISLSILCSICLVTYYSKRITPLLIKYAEIKTKEITLKIMNKSLSEEISKGFPEKILTITRNTNNEIELLNYDTKLLTNLLGNISTNIEKNLDILENGNLKDLNLEGQDLNNYYGQGLIYNISLGSATNNLFLSNLGPKIPIKLKTNSDLTTGINANIKDYGINNALIELDLTIEADIQIILPFASKNSKITFTTPLSIQMINGKIPSYYLENGLNYKNNQKD